MTIVHAGINRSSKGGLLNPSSDCGISGHVWMAYRASCTDCVGKLNFASAAFLKLSRLPPGFAFNPVCLGAPPETLCASSSGHRRQVARANSMGSGSGQLETTSFRIPSAAICGLSAVANYKSTKERIQLPSLQKVGGLQLNIDPTRELNSRDIAPQFHTNAHCVHVKFRSNFI